MGGFTAAASSYVVTSLFVASPGSAGFVQVEAGSSFAGMLTLNAAPSVDTTITLTVSDLPIRCEWNHGDHELHHRRLRPVLTPDDDAATGGAHRLPPDDAVPRRLRIGLVFAAL